MSLFPIKEERLIFQSYQNCSKQNDNLSNLRLTYDLINSPVSRLPFFPLMYFWFKKSIVLFEPYTDEKSNNAISCLSQTIAEIMAY